MENNDVFAKYPVVLIEFYATWCPHCQRMMPVMDQIKEILGESIPVLQFDIDKYPDLAENADITGTPTFLIYNKGVEVWRHSGEIDGNDLLAKVQSFAK